ncbi:MAG: glucokinase, partial [Burkholderiales bacterium]
LAGEDPPAAISRAALERRDPVCVRSLEMFVDIYAAEASNLALKMRALGGVYLGGGIAPKILPALEDGRFVRSFRDNGRMSEVLGKIEIKVSLNPAAALIGAAHLAAELI